MRTVQIWLAAVGSACVVTQELPAQTGQRYSGQGSLLFASLFGEEYEDIGNGVGFEIQGRYTPSAFSVGVGFQYTSHGIDEPGVDADFSLSGGFVEPRYVIPTSSNNLAPYVSARLSILRESLNLEGFEGSATGLNANLGGGILFRAGPRVNIDAGATYGYTNFGEIEIEDEDGDFVGSAEGGPGTNLVLRLGVAVGLSD